MSARTLAIMTGCRSTRYVEHRLEMTAIFCEIADLAGEFSEILAVTVIAGGVFGVAWNRILHELYELKLRLKILNRESLPEWRMMHGWTAP